MKKFYLQISSLLIIALFFIGCGGAPNQELKDSLEELSDELAKLEEEAEAPVEVSGDIFTSDDGKFQIRFPGDPEVTSENVPTDVGDIEMFTFMYEKSVTEVYMVAYSDYPSAMIELSKTEDLIQGAKEGVVGNIGATIEEEKKITLGDYEGIMFKAASETYFLYYKLYMVKNRLYQIGILRDGSYPEKSAVTDFIDSFKLVEE